MGRKPGRYLGWGIGATTIRRISRRLKQAARDWRKTAPGALPPCRLFISGGFRDPSSRPTPRRIVLRPMAAPFLDIVARGRFPQISPCDARPRIHTPDHPCYARRRALCEPWHRGPPTIRRMSYVRVFLLSPPYAEYFQREGAGRVRHLVFPHTLVYDLTQIFYANAQEATDRATSRKLRSSPIKPGGAFASWTSAAIPRGARKF